MHPKSPNELSSKEVHSTEEANNEIPKEIYVYVSRKNVTNYWLIKISIII